MGRMKLRSGIKAIEEEPPDEMESNTNRASLACMINAEVAAVLAIMRRNVRWGGQYMAGDDLLEHPLIQSLKALRRQIFSWEQHQWYVINPILYLQPFLDVIRSEDTTAPITVVALASVYKILSLDMFDLSTVNVDGAMRSVVETVTSCRFEVSDPASEEAVLMKILQVLLVCMKSKVSSMLSNQHVLTIVNTCFRIVHQAGTKGELLQRISRYTMQELVQCIFSHLPNVVEEYQPDQCLVNGGGPFAKSERGGLEKDHALRVKQLDNGNIHDGLSAKTSDDIPVATVVSLNGPMASSDTDQTLEPYGIPCMVEIFHFLCSLLNAAELIEMGPRMNQITYDEDVPLFALGLINSVIELGGSSISRHPKLLSLVQDELFRNLMQFGLSMSPLILSMVCSIVLNLYHHLLAQLKLQFEAFFSCVILRLAQSRYGASYQQQEVAMEALVDFCRQKAFIKEMYANFDCDITCSNVFEELTNLLSKSAFPVKCPLSTMHLLALEGLISVIQDMVERAGNSSSPIYDRAAVKIEEYSPFWMVKCENYSDPDHWIQFVRRRKNIKRRLMIGADHFNHDPKKGLKFLQAIHLLPEKLDPQSVACFFRYTAGLDKNLVGDFLGNHDEFCIQVLHEFVRTFDFQDMNLDTALRLFLETFRLPGESQKIQRVLEAFSERYYEQSPQILANKDAALLLSYSLILLNTDQHNVQVKKKMTEEDFIRNNRLINDGSDLPRDFLSELYHSICQNEIRTIPEQGAGFAEMTPSRWVDLMCKSRQTTPFLTCGSGAHLDREMFAIMSGPTIAAISVVFDNAEHEEVFRMCNEGFHAISKISACHHLEDVLDDLVVSLCKFTTLLNPSSIDEPVMAFGDDAKARMATETVFTITNGYGDYIRTGWRNILDCILRLHKLGLLPARVVSGAADDAESPTPPSSTTTSSSETTHSGRPVLATSALGSVPQHVPAVAMGTPRKSSGLMGRFSQLLSLDAEEPRTQPTRQQLAAHQRAIQTIQKCHIDSIFTESKFLHADSLLHLTKALINAASRSQRGSMGHHSPEDEDTAVFCLELLIAITLNNRDRIRVLWNDVIAHISNIIKTTMMPCTLVERAVFGLLRICQRLLPYKENLAEDLVMSLQLVLKLDARVADAYCENITVEVARLVKANADLIRSNSGWKMIISLLSVTSRHLEASEPGFEALEFIITDGGGRHLTPDTYKLALEVARQFAISPVVPLERSVRALDLMEGSATCIARWVTELGEGENEEFGNYWVQLMMGLKNFCLDQREDVHNHAVTCLQRCAVNVHGVTLRPSSWMQIFDPVLFCLLDELLDIATGHSSKDYRNMEGMLLQAMKLLSKAFLHWLKEMMVVGGGGGRGGGVLRKVWLGVLGRMEKYMKAKVRGKRSERLQELVPELLKNMVLVMKANGLLVKRAAAIRGDSLWELTWLHIRNIAPLLQSEVFPNMEENQSSVEGIAPAVAVTLGETAVAALGEVE
ncbi:ARF guanine-nucleotide exchange factor GNOM [Acorus gramineus]|uniref:ARF guanine-nucleotide exchange factor GNOM n=1 Tax=Acorus gramineus TaxID=55184 RepID=A0AAV9B2N5_ACOGR|nr:ARF guanine-nucleotide exchange factor GNOM [Acorus gramineus]